MKSPNTHTTSFERAQRLETVVSDRKFWAFVLLLAVSPILFCSCQSANTPFSSKSANNPYAQNEPKTPEEEAYYRDVYSGDWREQTGPAGMGKSIAKKTGSLTMPPHWNMRPDGSKDLAEVNAVAARRAPSVPVASNPYPLPTPSTSAPEPVAVSVPQASYAAAPTQPTYAAQAQPTYAPAPQAPEIQYTPIEQQSAFAESVVQQQAAAQAALAAQQQQAAAQAAYAAQQQAAAQAAQAAYVNQQQQYQAAPQSALPTQTLQAQPSVPQAAPAQQAYPQYTPSSFSSAAYSAPKESDLVVRGQAPEADAETAAPKEEAKPAVEMTKENVQAKVAEKATVVLDESRAGGVVVKPVVVDPSIAAPYADVRRPVENPSKPSDASAPRASHDEYVISGGDSKNKVVAHDDWLVENLDAEDAAAHFDTTDGRILTEPANRVFIYSPRFGAVRQVIAPIAGSQRTALDVAATAEGAQVQANEVRVDVRTQDEKLLSATGTQEVAGAESALAPSTMGGRVGVIEADGQLRLHEMLTQASVDNLDSEDSALMMDGAVAAQGWSDKKGVAVATDRLNAFANVYLDGPSTVYQVQDGTKTSKLRVVKIANKDSARPGEFVEFTLRFENIGDEPIGNVTILDNLSARLRYVDGTAKSSVPAEFLADLSETGSLVLRWEIADPLEPKQFGVVRFICKVQ